MSPDVIGHLNMFHRYAITPENKKQKTGIRFMMKLRNKFWKSLFKNCY